MKTRLLLLLVFAACESNDVGQVGVGAALVCYMMRSDLKCELCLGARGLLCTSCCKITVCDACQDVSGEGCWKHDVLVKCSWSCPAGNYLDGQEIK